MTYPERACNAIGCARAVVRSESGRVVYGFCDSHLRALLSGAFGPDTHERPGAEPQGVPATQRADALAGGSSDGGSPETERAISSSDGTPGRTFSIPGWAEPELRLAWGDR